MYTMSQRLYTVSVEVKFTRMGIVLGGSLTVKNQWELLTGDDGVWFLGYYSLYVNLLKCSVVPEVLEIHVVPSDEVRIVPLSPTPTNNGLEVVGVVEDSSFSLQEMKVRLKRDIKIMYKTLFIFSLYQ